jgi:hypothetical protein
LKDDLGNPAPPGCVWQFLIGFVWCILFIRIWEPAFALLEPILAPLTGSTEADAYIMIALLIAMMAGQIATWWVSDKLFGTKFYALWRARMFGTRKDLGRLDPW